MGILNRKAIKQEARAFLAVDKRWLNMFAATVLIYLLSNAQSIYTLFTQKLSSFKHGNIQYFFDYYANRSGDFQLDSVLSNLFFVVKILIIPFAAASAGYFLNHLRGFNPSAKSLYKEVSDNYGYYFKNLLLTYISVFLWTLLLIVPGMIKAFEYSQVPYLLHDNNRLTHSQAKKISMIMTSGFKSELFLLELSFIGWYFIGALTGGIAYIYILPYINTVRAMYYENLKNNAIDRGLIAPEAFMSVPPVYNYYQGFNGNNQYNNYNNFENFQRPVNPDNSSFTDAYYQNDENKF